MVPNLKQDIHTTQRAFSMRLTPPKTSLVYCAAAGTIFGTTDVYELGFSYLFIISLTGISIAIPFALGMIGLAIFVDLIRGTVYITNTIGVTEIY